MDELPSLSERQLGYVVAFVTATVVRAMGVTVRSGETALLFSFGRARQDEPYFLVGEALLPFHGPPGRATGSSR